MDRKRNVLIREMMQLIDKATALQAQIDDCYKEAYEALQTANILHGVCDEIAGAVPVERGLMLRYRSVMGVELPEVTLESGAPEFCYGFSKTGPELDEAFLKFDRVKHLTADLAEIENSVYRLATAVSKTQKRANALKNIILPKLSAQAKFISDSLEEKEREDFSRLKVIKKQKEST